MAVSYPYPPDATGPGPFGGAGVFNLSTWPLSSTGEVKLWARQSTPGDPFTGAGVAPNGTVDSTAVTVIANPGWTRTDTSVVVPANTAVTMRVIVRTTKTKPASSTGSGQIFGPGYALDPGQTTAWAYYPPGTNVWGLTLPSDTYAVQWSGVLQAYVPRTLSTTANIINDFTVDGSPVVGFHDSDGNMVQVSRIDTDSSLVPIIPARLP